MPDFSPKTATLRTTVSCLDDLTVLDFIAGTLEPAEVARIDAHVDRCAACRELVLSVARADAAPETTPSPGATFARFTLLERLGAGAMGIVYAAHDPELDRRIALKLLNTSADDPTTRTRLLAEAKAMAKLSHPNVVTIYDVGATGDRVFIAMELIDGPTLRAWAAGSERSWRQVRDACVQAGQGLAAAHRAGLVHRDYKPENVLVGPDRARVGDFGLATGTALVTANASLDAIGSTTLTQTGALVGTPAYMAPEQLRGERPGPASDQFAFCVATFEALVGRRPFAGETLDALRAAIDAGSIQIPESTDVPGWVLAALRRGLQASADARHPSMDALLEALQRDRRTRTGVRLGVVAALVATASGTAYAVGAAAPDPPTPDCSAAQDAVAEVWNPARSDALRNAIVAARPTYGATLAATVTEAIDTWASAWGRTRGQACRDARDPTIAFARVDAQVSCLTARREDLSALITAWIDHPESSVDRLDDAIAELPDLTTCTLSTVLDVAPAPPTPELKASVAELRSRAAAIRAQIASGQFDAAAAAAAPLLAAAQQTHYEPMIAEAWLVVATAARHRGELAYATEAAYEALWAAQPARHDRVVAQAWVAILAISAAAGNFEEAPRLGRHGQAAVARVGSPPPLQARLHNTLGVAYENLGRYDEAETALRRALAIRREQFGPSSAQAASVLTNLGNLARAQGRIDDAMALHRDAMAIDTRLLGKSHPTIGRHLHNLARVLLLAGQRDAALEHYQRALQIKTAAYGDIHVEVARTHNSMGLLFAADGTPDTAVTAFASALKIYTALRHPEEALVALNLGQQQTAAGRPRDAIAHYDAAAQIIEDHWGLRSRHYARLVVARADAELALGRRSDARGSYTLAHGLAAALPDPSLLEQAQIGLATTGAPPRRRKRITGISDAPPPGTRGRGRARSSSVPPTSANGAPPPATEGKPKPASPPSGAYVAGPALDDP